MKPVTIRWPDQIHAEISQTAKRTGQSFQKVVLSYFSKNSLVKLLTDETKSAMEDVVDAVTRLDRKTEARLLSLEGKLGGVIPSPAPPALVKNGVSQVAVLLLAQVILEASPLAEKQRVKVIVDRVKATPEDPSGLSALLSELSNLLPDDRLGNGWKTTLKIGIEKIGRQ